MRGGATEGLFGRKGKFSIRGHILLYILIQHSTGLTPISGLWFGLLSAVRGRSALSHVAWVKYGEEHRETWVGIDAAMNKIALVFFLLSFYFLGSGIKTIKIILKQSKWWDEKIKNINLKAIIPQ